MRAPLPDRQASATSGPRAGRPDRGAAPRSHKRIVTESYGDGAHEGARDHDDGRADGHHAWYARCDRPLPRRKRGLLGTTAMRFEGARGSCCTHAHGPCVVLRRFWEQRSEIQRPRCPKRCLGLRSRYVSHAGHTVRRFLRRPDGASRRESARRWRNTAIRSVPWPAIVVVLRSNSGRMDPSQQHGVRTLVSDARDAWRRPGHRRLGHQSGERDLLADGTVFYTGGQLGQATLDARKINPLTAGETIVSGLRNQNNRDEAFSVL